MATQSYPSSALRSLLAPNGPTLLATVLPLQGAHRRTSLLGSPFGRLSAHRCSSDSDSAAIIARLISLP